MAGKAGFIPYFFSFVKRENAIVVTSTLSRDSLVQTHNPVMPGLVPGIHVSRHLAAKTVDGRDKPGRRMAGTASI
jgi:hypothetical protein